jgi:hypothetical protein
MVVYVKIRTILMCLIGMDVEGFSCGLLYCIIPASGKNESRKTHEDTLASGPTFWTRNWPRILSATNLTPTIYKITMYNSSVNGSHKQSNYLRSVLMWGATHDSYLGHEQHADIWQLCWNNFTAFRWITCMFNIQSHQKYTNLHSQNLNNTGNVHIT